MNIIIVAKRKELSIKEDLKMTMTPSTANSMSDTFLDPAVHLLMAMMEEDMKNENKELLNT